MRLIISEQEKKEILSSYILIESVKQAKKYVELGLLPNDILDKLISIDPSKTNKYVGWMSKIWISENPDLDKLRNTIEEYDVFLNKGKVKTKDINQFKTFDDLYSEINDLKQSGLVISNKDLLSDYETIVDNNDILVVTPHTHDASRKLGLTQFKYKPKINAERNASQWCTTFKSPIHFNCYYYSRNDTLYYVKVKSKHLIEKLNEYDSKKNRSNNLLNMVALKVSNDGKIEGFDSDDYELSDTTVENFLSIINLNKDILIPRRSFEERRTNLKKIVKKNIQDYINNESKGDLTIELSDTLGNLTSVDGNLSLLRCSFETLGNLTFVNGNLEINHCFNLKTLGNLTSVKGNLILRNIKVNFKENPNWFGNLKYIGGNLDIGTNPGPFYNIAGKMRPNDFETEIRKMIEIKGKII